MRALSSLAFAGLRTSELLRLNWSEVNLARGYIEVKAEKTKSARRRLVEIMPNLAAWLATTDPALRQGPVWSHGSWRTYFADSKKLCHELGVKW